MITGWLSEDDGASRIPSIRLSKINVFPLKYGGWAYRRHRRYPSPVHDRWLDNFRRIEEGRPGAMARKPAITTVIWILFLLIPIVFDVTLWATFYYVGGALPSFEEALYFSTVTFTTV